jgi:hypothetical protein
VAAYYSQPSLGCFHPFRTGLPACRPDLVQLSSAGTLLLLYVLKCTVRDVLGQQSISYSLVFSVLSILSSKLRTALNV